MLELGSKILISYLIGSLMGSMIVGRLRGGVDIRELGSGNAGGTNALRTQGFGFALGVILIDIGKGVIGAGLVPGLELPFIAVDPEISRTWLTVSCAGAAVVGHVWPIFHGFRGGKGAADPGGHFDHSRAQSNSAIGTGLGLGTGNDWLRWPVDNGSRHCVTHLDCRNTVAGTGATFHLQRGDGDLHRVLPSLEHATHAQRYRASQYETDDFSSRRKSQHR